MKNGSKDEDGILIEGPTGSFWIPNRVAAQIAATPLESWTLSGLPINNLDEPRGQTLMERNRRRMSQLLKRRLGAKQ